ncbi:MAG: hypothetical protein KAT12_00010 [Gammaproteobacteria bacterium]|nr:hypothetical protein [Gammaproteobacteria bacterium]
MNKFLMYIAQTLITIVLSLSSTVIYAEVSAKRLDQNTAVKKSAVPVPVELPRSSSDNAVVGWELHAEQWELARSGETILALPVLKRLLKAWLSEQHKVIEIRYPGGEDGEFWVQELTDWLVSLGIPSKYMVKTPGSGADDVIKFNIIK